MAFSPKMPGTSLSAPYLHDLLFRILEPGVLRGPLFGGSWKAIEGDISLRVLEVLANPWQGRIPARRLHFNVFREPGGPDTVPLWKYVYVYMHELYI